MPVYAHQYRLHRRAFRLFMPPVADLAQLSQAEAIERMRQRYASLEVQLSERTWALEEALRAAEEAARSKSNLLAVMSH